MHPTLLIGLDGATYTILDDLVAKGVMPFLAEWYGKGSRLVLESTVNPLTPPAWISMVTGRSPAAHGVFDFIWAEQRKNQHYFTLYNFRDIRCETIWSMVSRAGGRSGCCNFTMMAPPPAVNGYVIPGLVSWKHLRRNTWPRQLYDELKTLDFFSPRTLAWDFELEKKAEQGIAPEEYEAWVRYHIDREEQWFRLQAHLMTRHPCDLTAVLFDGTDKIFHMGYRFLDPAIYPGLTSPWERHMRRLCLDYFRALDGFLAELTRLAGDEARVFIASDHGFAPSWFAFRVNTWLEENGYLHWRDIDGLPAEEQAKARRLQEQHFVYLDWERTVAYAHSVTANGIFIRRPVGGAEGDEEGRYQALRRQLAQQLLQLTEPESGRPIVSRVLTREEAYPGPGNHRAPDLFLVLADHGFVSIRDLRPAIVRRPEIAGTHHPEGVLLGRGPEIRPGQAGRCRMVDVAPALLHSLGLPIPEDLEGEVPAGLFTDTALAARPVCRGPATVAPEGFATADSAPSPAEGQDEIFAQMRALGYLE